MVHRRCLQLLGDAQLAEEAAQDVFVQVVRSAPRLEDRAPSSYLYQAATTVSLNLLRSRRRRAETPDGDLALTLAVETGTEGRLSARQLLDRLLHRQKPDTGLIAVLHWVDGMTLEEVAHEVGLSVSGVRKRLAEVKERTKRLGDVS